MKRARQREQGQTIQKQIEPLAFHIKLFAVTFDLVSRAFNHRLKIARTFVHSKISHAIHFVIRIYVLIEFA